VRIHTSKMLGNRAADSARKLVRRSAFPKFKLFTVAEGEMPEIINTIASPLSSGGELPSGSHGGLTAYSHLI